MLFFNLGELLTANPDVKNKVAITYKNYKKNLISKDIFFNQTKALLNTVDANYFLASQEKIEKVEILNSKIYDNHELISIRNPSELPNNSNIKYLLEPICKAEIIAPEEYIGKVIDLINQARGECLNMNLLGLGQIIFEIEVPLSEIIVDFYDNLKSLTRGYASLSYTVSQYKQANLEKIDILLNGKIIDPLSIIKHSDRVIITGKAICEKLKEIIPRQQIEIIIQAAIGLKIIARETIKPFRKDVTAKLYGGDITRRMKLLEKQKEGKKRMKSFGNIEVPKEAFIKILSC
jgi:GTP-binding protein LepA